MVNTNVRNRAKHKLRHIDMEAPITADSSWKAVVRSGSQNQHSLGCTLNGVRRKMPQEWRRMGSARAQISQCARKNNGRLRAHWPLPFA